MSDHSDNGSEDSQLNKSGDKDDDICRDFLRNVCKRGKRCKYRHPSADEARDLGRNNITFCHDFQNTGCRRNNCKFLHCTREEEEHYKQTGQLPVRLQQAAALGIGVTPPAVDVNVLRGEVPICKDFLKGNCKRGNKCKFRHMNTNGFDFELRKSDHRNNNSQLYDPYDDDLDRFEGFEYGHGTGIKRRRTEREFDGFSGFDGRYSSNRPFSYQLLEEENTMLRRKVDELKKQVADLTATNEVLLEQNARYRVSRTNAVQTMNGVVPVSQALTPGINAATAQAQSLVTSIAQQLALNSELASQQVLQQRLARELGQAAPGSLPGQTLNASVTMNPASIVPVSLPQNVSLAPVSMQQNLPPPTVSMNQSIPANLQGPPSTPLVSYPIVSHDMRAAPRSLAH
ncbi:hypothetical protein FSP39_007365 [Pinctada imbricata]|uniref:Zinc finger CCCH domain-containing protein 10 n=1 Tax=Pinctada imbricata TaxID=66713 RepID=A0AA88YHQ9_PINIB|nr:hypothetical protein FSP39_007365 [Pinctada imbricata]